jgi:hypothetical protein
MPDTVESYSSYFNFPISDKTEAGVFIILCPCTTAAATYYKMTSFCIKQNNTRRPPSFTSDTSDFKTAICADLLLVYNKCLLFTKAAQLTRKLVFQIFWAQSHIIDCNYNTSAQTDFARNEFQRCKPKELYLSRRNIWGGGGLERKSDVLKEVKF